MSKDSIGKQFLQQLQSSQKFIKVTSKDDNIGSASSGRKLTDAERVKLIRLANGLFNQGKIEEAKRIFSHVSYIDGIIRVGDYYYKQNRFIEAIYMYRLAQSQEKLEEIMEHIVSVMRKWINS